MGHVYYKYLRLSLGALGQAIINIIKIINRSTNFINKLLYMHFVTVIGSFNFSNLIIKSYNIVSYSLSSILTGCNSLYSLCLVSLFL
jgi:hypothetical protein